MIKPIKSTEQFKKAILDLGAGCGLLCSNELSIRVFNGMQQVEQDVTDAEELIHVIALGLARMHVDGIAESWMMEQWSEASRYYHKHLCPECLAGRKAECVRPKELFGFPIDYR